jgi:hypothetical protein
MLFALLPDEIIREKIMPYTYLPQKYELLEEIKTFDLNIDKKLNKYINKYDFTRISNYFNDNYSTNDKYKLYKSIKNIETKYYGISLYIFIYNNYISIKGITRQGDFFNSGFYLKI